MIRRLPLLLIVLCIAIAPVHSQSTAEQAEQAYLQRDYALAITLYEQLLRSEGGSGALYINLGNAYYEAGNLGAALLNYRRAARYLPRDPQLQINLLRVRVERFDPLQNEQNWLIAFATVTHDLLTFTELSLIAFALWGIFFGLLGVWVFRKRAGDLLRLLIGGAGIALIVALALLASRYLVDRQQPPAVVVTANTQAMSGPGDSYLPLFPLYSAAEIRILEEQDNWLRFVLPGGEQGWIPRDDVGYITRHLG